MLVAAQRLVKCAFVLYLVTHGLPIAAEVDLRDVATAVLWSLQAQLRISTSR
jgi:hypothetical protein